MTLDEEIPNESGNPEDTTTELNSFAARTPSPNSKQGEKSDSSRSNRLTSEEQRSATSNEDIGTSDKLSTYTPKSRTPDNDWTSVEKPSSTSNESKIKMKSPQVLRSRSVSPISMLENLMATPIGAAKSELPPSSVVNKPSTPLGNVNASPPIEAVHLNLPASRNTTSPTNSIKETSGALSAAARLELPQSPAVTSSPAENTSAAAIELPQSPATAERTSPTERVSAPSAAAKLELPPSPAVQTTPSPTEQASSGYAVAKLDRPQSPTVADTTSPHLPPSAAASKTSAVNQITQVISPSVAANVALPDSRATNGASPTNPASKMLSPSVAANHELPPSPAVNNASPPGERLTAPSIAANLELPPSPANNPTSPTDPPDRLSAPSAAAKVQLPPSPAVHESSPADEANVDAPRDVPNTNNNNNMSVSHNNQTNQRSAVSVAAEMELPASQLTNDPSPASPTGRLAAPSAAVNLDLPPSPAQSSVSSIQEGRPGQTSSLSTAAKKELPAGPANEKTLTQDHQNKTSAPSAMSVAAALELPSSAASKRTSPAEQPNKMSAPSVAADLELPPSPANSTRSKTASVTANLELPSSPGVKKMPGTASVAADLQLPESPDIIKTPIKSPEADNREVHTSTDVNKTLGPASVAANLELPASPDTKNVSGRASVAAKLELPHSPQVTKTSGTASVAANQELPSSPDVKRTQTTTSVAADVELPPSPAKRNASSLNRVNDVTTVSAAANIELPSSPTKSMASPALKENDSNDAMSPKQHASPTPKENLAKDRASPERQAPPPDAVVSKKPKSPPMRAASTRQSSANIFSDPDVEMEELKHLRMSTTPQPQVTSPTPQLKHIDKEILKPKDDKEKPEESGNTKSNVDPEKEHKETSDHEQDKKDKNRKGRSKEKSERVKDEADKDKDKDRTDRDRQRKERDKDRKRREKDKQRNRDDGENDDKDKEKDQKERDRERRRERKRKQRREAEKKSKDDAGNEPVEVDGKDKSEKRKRHKEKRPEKRSKDKQPEEKAKEIPAAEDGDNKKQNTAKIKPKPPTDKHAEEPEVNKVPADSKVTQDTKVKKSHVFLSSGETSAGGSPMPPNALNSELLRKSILARLNIQEWKEQLQDSSSDDESVIDLPKTPPRPLSARSDDENGTQIESRPADIAGGKPGPTEKRKPHPEDAKKPRRKEAKNDVKESNQKTQETSNKIKGKASDETKSERKSKDVKSKTERPSKTTKERKPKRDDVQKKRADQTNAEPKESSDALDKHDKDPKQANQQLKEKVPANSKEKQKQTKRSNKETKPSGEKAKENTKSSSKQHSGELSTKSSTENVKSLSQPEEKSVPPADRAKKSLPDTQEWNDKNKSSEKPKSESFGNSQPPKSGDLNERPLASDTEKPVSRNNKDPETSDVVNKRSLSKTSEKIDKSSPGQTNEEANRLPDVASNSSRISDDEQEKASRRSDRNKQPKSSIKQGSKSEDHHDSAKGNKVTTKRDKKQPTSDVKSETRTPEKDGIQKSRVGESQTGKNKHIPTPNLPKLLKSPSEFPPRIDHKDDTKSTGKSSDITHKSTTSVSSKEDKSKADTTSINSSIVSRTSKQKPEEVKASVSKEKKESKTTKDKTIAKPKSTETPISVTKVESRVSLGSSKTISSPKEPVETLPAPTHTDGIGSQSQLRKEVQNDIGSVQKTEANGEEQERTSAKSGPESVTSTGNDSAKSSRKLIRDRQDVHVERTPYEHDRISKLKLEAKSSKQEPSRKGTGKTQQNPAMEEQANAAPQTQAVEPIRSYPEKNENVATPGDNNDLSDGGDTASDEGEVITLETLKKRAEQAAKEKAAKAENIPGPGITREQAQYNLKQQQQASSAGHPPRVQSSVVKRPAASARPRRSALASARPRRSAIASRRSRATSAEDQSLFQYPLTYTPVEENKEESDLAHLRNTVSRASVNVYKKPKNQRKSNVAQVNQNQFSDSEEEPEEVFLTRLHDGQSEKDDNDEDSRGLHSLYDKIIRGEVKPKAKSKSKSKFPWKTPSPVSLHQFEMSDEMYLQTKSNATSTEPKSTKPIKSILKSGYDSKQWTDTGDDDVSSLDEDENVYNIFNVPKKKPPFAARPFLPEDDDDDEEEDEPSGYGHILNQAAFANSANMHDPIYAKLRQSGFTGRSKSFVKSDDETLKQTKSRKGILKTSLTDEGKPQRLARRISRIPVRTKSQAEKLILNKSYETPDDSDGGGLKLKKSKSSVSFTGKSPDQRKANAWMGKNQSRSRRDRNASSESSGDDEDVPLKARDYSKQKTKSTIRMQSRASNKSRSSNKSRNRYNRTSSNYSSEDDSDPLGDYTKQRTKSTIRIRSANRSPSPPHRSKSKQKKPSSKSNDENPQMKMLQTLLEAAKEHLILTNKLKDETVTAVADENNNEAGVLLSGGEEPLDPKSLTLLKKSISSTNLKKSPTEDTKNEDETKTGPRHLVEELKDKEAEEEGASARVMSTKVMERKSITPKGSEIQNVSPVSIDQPTPPRTTDSTFHIGSSPPYSPITPENEGETITMEYLKNHIKSILPALPKKDLNHVSGKLMEMGVRTEQDLEFVQKEDLEKTRLNPIQARKLLTAWKPNTADGRRSIAGSAVELPTDTDHLPAEELIDKNRWLKFNVGGVMLETTRDTIDRLQSPFLALLLDPDSEDVEPPSDGIYRIDRNPEAFQILLDYARYGKIVGNLENIGEEFLMEEIEYYKMDRSVSKCVTDYFDEKRKAPNAGGIEVEKVSITEMSLNKEYKHHNSYGITHTTNISCYTSVPGGKGVCQADVQSLFLYETAYLRFPALFRAPCLKCGHIVCFADDPLIGTEGWCHKCHLCLRCQDMLCEGLSDDGDSRGLQSLREDLVRKTAKVVFVHHAATSQDPYDFSSPRNGKLALVPYQGGRENVKTPTQAKTLKFKLPKIPDVMDVPQHSVRANMYRKSNTEHPMSRSFSDFGKW